jgi:hypothetical protein
VKLAQFIDCRNAVLTITESPLCTSANVMELNVSANERALLVPPKLISNVQAATPAVLKSRMQEANLLNHQHCDA